MLKHLARVHDKVSATAGPRRDARHKVWSRACGARGGCYQWALEPEATVVQSRGRDAPVRQVKMDEKTKATRCGSAENRRRPCDTSTESTVARKRSERHSQAHQPAGSTHP